MNCSSLSSARTDSGVRSTSVGRMASCASCAPFCRGTGRGLLGHVLRRRASVRSQSAHLADGLAGQARRVGAHVGDQAHGPPQVHALVELLGDLHGALGREAEAVGGRLLQGAGDERRRRVHLLRLRLDARPRRAGAPASSAASAGAARRRRPRAAGPAPGPPRPIRTRRAVKRPRRRGLRARPPASSTPRAGRRESPPRARTPGAAPRTARGRRSGRAEALPQHRADLVAHQAVEHAARLLRVRPGSCRCCARLREAPAAPPAR